tara:strand:- start:1717 stop:2985 length:1269 start_codon:yes stop_codon:yes gene_type:complete
MQKNLFFSIIVPTFNTGKKLKRCLDSISKKQNKKNFEVIVVDDKSNDSTLKIINTLKKNFLNFKLIKNKKNLGPGASRNLGISQSEGKYIIYLDSDDFFFPNILKKLENSIIKNNYPEIILNNVQRSKTSDNLPILNYFKKKIYSKNNFFKILEREKISFNECWHFVFKNTKFKKIRFLKTRLAEDNWYVMSSLLHCSNIYINKFLKTVYHTSTIKSQKHLVGIEALKSYADLTKSYKKILKKQKNHTIVRYINYKIKMNEKLLANYLYLSNYNELKKIYHKKICAHLNHFKNSSNSNFVKFKSNFKNFLNDYEKKILLLKKNKSPTISCNLFCVDYIGKAALKYLNKNKIKINKLIDDNTSLRGQHIFKMKIFSFKDLKRKDIVSSLNLICHQKINIYKQIKKKLIKKGGRSLKIYHFQGA